MTDVSAGDRLDARVQTLRIGVAGLGFGLDVHVPAFEKIEGVAVTALLCRNANNLPDIEARTGVKAYAHLESFLDHGLDAVSVAVPPNEMAAIVAGALKRGLAVLCEKPLGPNYEIASRLAQAAKGGAHVVDFEFADMATFAALREAINNGEIGHIRQANIMWHGQSRAFRGGGWSWKTDASRGGGVLALFGTHLLYMTEQLLGPAVRLTARLDTRIAELLKPSADAVAADDLALITMEHRDGCVTTISCGNANPGLSAHRWTFAGERGSAILENPTFDPVSGFTLRVIGQAGDIVRKVEEPAIGGDGRIPLFSQLASRFVKSVRHGEVCKPDFSDAARVAFLTDAVRKSSVSGAWVDVAGAQ